MHHTARTEYSAALRRYYAACQPPWRGCYNAALQKYVAATPFEDIISSSEICCLPTCCVKCHFKISDHATHTTPAPILCPILSPTVLNSTIQCLCLARQSVVLSVLDPMVLPAIYFSASEQRGKLLAPKRRTGIRKGPHPTRQSVPGTTLSSYPTQSWYIQPREPLLEPF